jgi:type I restriction enzyme, S subunit
MSEWHTISLREANVSLIDCEHRTPPEAASGHPYVAIPQIKHGRIDVTDARLISQEHFTEWTRKAAPQPYDVALSRRCNPGETAFVPPGLEFALGQNLVLLRADGTRVYPPFLRWLVRGTDWWEQIGKFINVGAVFNSLKCADIPNFRLRIPPLAEQRIIAHTLGALDGKIELNQRMNDTLEATASTIFKSWFVKFDPVRAKAEGRKPCGMDVDTADQFPDSFQDSLLGNIPTGWKAIPASEALDINPSRPMATGTEAPYLDMQNVPTRGHRPKGWITRRFVSGSRFSNGDTLVARITPCLENGKTTFVDFLKDAAIGWGSTEFIVLRPKNPLPPEYGYCLARDEDFRAHAIQSMTGSSGRQRVPTGSLSQFLVALPPEPIAKCFKDAVHPLFAKMKANSEESSTLGAIRDVLLPKLISGELRVKAAETLLGAKV